MLRREFLALLSAAMVWPRGASADAAPMPKIAFLGGSSSAGGEALVQCFLSGLHDLGWTDGENIKIDVRWTEGLADRYAAIAAELPKSKFDLIVVTSTPGTKAVQKLSGNIPIVFLGVSDPVASGFVRSLASPGGNLTGISNFMPATSGKLIEFLKTAVPTAKRFCVLHNPTNPGKVIEVQELNTAGQTLGVIVDPVAVRAPGDFDGAFAQIVGDKCDALITLQEGLTLGNRRKISDFALANRVPTIFQIREFVEAGGLMSYGLNYCQHYRQAAPYVDKVLKGARPADLPVELPSRFELVLNLKTARALQLTLPDQLLNFADDLIE